MNEHLESLISSVDPLQLRIELFRKGDFSFIVEGEDEDGNWVSHEKQREALKQLTSGNYDEFLYGGAAGGSKGLSEDELVLTPFGFREIGKLEVGSKICATDGTIQQVIQRHDNGVIPFYRLTFSDGTILDCDYSHIWAAWKSKKGRKIKNNKTFGESSMRKYTTENMYEDYVNNKTIYNTPLTKPVVFNVSGSLYDSVNFVKRDLDPYVLGFILGDGCFRGKNVSFFTSEVQISSRIKEKYQISEYERKTSKGYTFSFVGQSGKFIKDYLKTIGLMGKYSYEKFIPKIYLHGSIDERWELLNGLMDSDGGADIDGDYYYSTSSKQLCEDLKYLARSLGCYACSSITEEPFYREKQGEKVLCRTNYKIRIKSKNPEKIFWLKRKKDRVKNKIHQSYSNKIVKIEKIKPKKSICITVSNPNSLFITKNFIVTHNSWTGCVWIMFTLLCYPETKAFIGRNELKDILDSVKVTFDKVAKAYGFSDYNFNAVKNFIQFGNGSHINFIEVKYKPSDPMYEDVGSTEYTIGWGEEIGEWHEMAATVLASRVGRHLNKRDHNGKIRKKPIKGTVLWTCNPKQNWGKSQFYDKHINGTLEKGKGYLQCLITENPFIEKDYVEKLRKIGDKNKSLYERLFKGNWDYEDNPNQLASQEMIEAIFDNDHVPEGKTYITADVAFLGSDIAVIIAWSGWIIKEIVTMDKSKTQDIVMAIMILRKKYRVPKTRCIADGDGAGTGVVHLAGIKSFRNNGRVIRMNKETPNYRNLQVQCLYLLADKINDAGIYIEADITLKEKEQIKKELAQIQSAPSKRGYDKLDCKSKAEIQSDIGGSPDRRDAIFMRIFFDLKKTLNLTTTWS